LLVGKEDKDVGAIFRRHTTRYGGRREMGKAIAEKSKLDQQVRPVGG
jgi:hypothetical protein